MYPVITLPLRATCITGCHTPSLHLPERMLEASSKARDTEQSLIANAHQVIFTGNTLYPAA